MNTLEDISRERYQRIAPRYSWACAPASDFLRRRRSWRQAAACRIAATRRMWALLTQS